MADWRAKLKNAMQDTDKSRQEKEAMEMSRFIAEVVLPAFSEITVEMKSHGRTATIRHTETTAAINVQFNGEDELVYRIQGRTFPTRTLPFADIRFRERKGLRLIRVESMFRDGASPYSLEDITKDEIIENFVDNYTRRVET